MSFRHVAPVLMASAAAFFLSSAALAETYDEPPPPPPPTGAPPPAAGPPPPADPPSNLSKSDAEGVHLHDGFYLNFGGGIGYLRDDLETDTIIFTRSGEAKGASLAFELTMGGSPKPGVILGGGVFTESVTDPEIEFGGTAVTDIEEGTLTMIGFFAEWYPKAHKGFFIRGALGPAFIRTKSSTNPDADEGPVGGFASFSLGYISGWESNGASARCFAARVHF